MKKTELINKLIETPAFKQLQSIGLKLHDNQRRFDLLTVYEELIDEMAWSRLFAYILDSTQNHGLQQLAFRLLLKKIPELNQFLDSLPLESESKITCVTEWKTESLRRLDILIKIVDIKGNTRGVLGIENKVDSGERKNQIRDYQKSLSIAFPRIPKLLLYLTPDGRLTQTSDDNKDCTCVSTSYGVLSNVCEQIILNTTGQGQVFMAVLKNYIDKLTNNQFMDEEALQLIRKLYRDNEFRQAIKLLSQYTPNTKNIFDELLNKFRTSKGLPFETESVSFHYYPKTSSTPYEFKVYIPDLTDVGHKKGFHGIYMLRCDTLNPDIGDYFTLRLVVGLVDKKEKDLSQKQLLREKILNAFSLPDGLGINKHWGRWTCVWTGDNYELSDFGDNDVQGLNALLLRGIKDTYQDFKAGLRKLARITL